MGNFLRAALLVAAVLGAPPCAAQGAWPSKPIRFVVSFPPGGSSDLVARLLAPRLGERLGQPLLVENRPGAGGNIGVDLVAKAPADGYTLGLAAAGALTINAHLYPSMPFDPQKDLAPVSMLAMIPIVIVASPSLGAGSLRELLALARARPGALSFGTTGAGSSMHLAGEALNQAAEVSMVHVPYKGSGPAAADAASGQLPLAIVDLTSALPYLRAGRLRALAVTGAARSVAAPEIPTVAESGFAGFDAVGWFGAVAPAGTPAPVIARLGAEIGEALRSRELRERILAGGAEPEASTPEQLAERIRAESARWAGLVRTAGLKLN